MQQAKPSILYAFDISTKSLSWITENVIPDHPSIHPIQNLEESVPLDDEIANLVFTIRVHYELESPGQILDKGFRILQTGEKILVVCWEDEMC